MRSRSSRVVRCLLAAMMAFSTQLAAVAGPYDDWTYRTPIALNNGSGAETLSDFPVLISLTSSNFDFVKAKADGSDLRFATSAGAVLSYEIEKWDSSGKVAAVWVKLPQLTAFSSTDFINMYTGNAAATDAQNAAGVWSNGYVGVWHLGASLNDSTIYGNHGTLSGTVTLAPGVAGDARYFNLGSVSSPAASNGSLDMGDNLSISYWMNGAAADQPGGYTRVLSKNPTPGWEYQRGGTDSNQFIRVDTSAGNNQVRAVGTNAFDGAWHFVANTLSAGSLMSYMDGGAPAANTYNQGTGFNNASPLLMGSGGGTQFRGTIDEVRISNVVRTPGWMNAEYRSQAGLITSLGTTAFVAGLKAEYSHENAGNRYQDTSGNGNDATGGGGGGGPTFVATGADTQGFAAGLGATVGSYVRGSNQYLDLPASLLTPAAGIDQSQGFTFTTLIYNDGASNDFRTILSSNRFRFQRSTDGVFRVDVKNSGGNQNYATATGVVQDNTWYFAALTYDAAGNLARTYLLPATGVISSPKLSFSPTEAFTNMTALRIGSDGLSGIGGADPWGGKIDNARFFQGALTKRQLRDVFYSYTGHVGPIGLVAQYSHENAANRLADDTGHGLDATNAGGVTFTAPVSPGNFSAALGTTAGQYAGSYLNVPELYTAGDDFTFMALVRVNADNSHQTILGTDRFRLQYYPQTAGDGIGSLLLQVNGAGSSGPISSTYGTFAPGQWQWVAMTYNAATNSIQTYVQPDSPVFFSSAINQTANGAAGLTDMSKFRIGIDGLSLIGGADPFAGQIDAVRFYDQAFTKAQIRQIFQQYRPGSTGPIGLVAHYTHENAADRLADDTGHQVMLANNGVTFVAATNPGNFSAGLGTTVGQFSGNSLDVRPFYNAGDDFTFVGLVRVTEESAFHTILSSDRFRFQYYPTGTVGDGLGGLRLDVNGADATGSATSANDTFALNQWYFAALTYNAATKSIQGYLQPDGLVFAGPALSRTANGVDGLNDMTRFRIGNDGLSGIGGGDPFAGQIDGVRFYDQALTTLQLRDLFRTLTGRPTGPLGLVARYEHENAGNRLADSSGNGLDATNGGGVTFAAPTSPGPFQLGTATSEFNSASTSYVDFPGVHTPGDDFTFTAMVRKQGGSAGHQTLLASDRFRFQFRSTDGTNGALRLDLNSTAGGGTTETPLGSFPADQWEFVVLQYSAATGQITAWLQDGSPVFLGPEYTATTTNRPYFDTISRFRLGGDGLSGVAGAGFDGFRGQMDGVRFYDTLLTKRQLRDVFREYNPLAGGAVGLVAQYTHESASPLADDTGHGVTATNRGSVTFVAPPAGGLFGPGLGSVVGQYPRVDNGSLDFPQFYTAGDDFTFTALVRKNSDESGGHQTILASNRFRLQFQNTGTESDGAGLLWLQVNGAGSAGPTASGAGSFETEEWYFVALRYSATSHVLEAFLDGAGGLDGPILSQTVNGATGLDDMLNFRVGADGLSGIGNPDAFGGWIDNIQFYDRFLSNAELQGVFASSVPEPATIVLLLLGMGAIPFLRRWRRRA